MAAGLDHRARRVHAGDLVVVASYVLAVALFAPFLVAGDGTFYYDLTRRLVGDGGIVYAYQWGTSLWDAPFYLIGHAVGLPHAIAPPHANGQPFRDVSVTIASGVAALAAVFVSRAAAVRLGLATPTLVLLGALFGSELWFYGVVEPSYTHALDALAFSAAAYLAVRLWQGAPPWVAVAFGATLAALVTVRYANLAALPGFLLVVLARREPRPALRVAVGAAAGALLLVALPLAVGTGFGHSADLGHRAGGGGGGAVTSTSTLSLDAALIPLRMLVSPDRGLLAYAPLCGVAAVGFALALRHARAMRVPLAAIGLAALGILVVYALTGASWTGGGYSYGQRFLTSLTVVTVIGLAELRRLRPRLTAVLVVLGVAWSLFVGINYLYGWAGVTNEHRNVDDIVRLYTSGDRSPQAFVETVASRLRERFS